MKALYDSPWHHPFAAYVAGAWLLFAIARRLPFLYAYLTIFLVEILADAVCTGGWSPVEIGTPAYTSLSVIFIVLGDFRYFFLVERVTRPERSLARVIAFTLPLSLLMPVVTGVMTRTIPAMQETRVLYLVYESALCVIVLALDRFRLQQTDVDDATKQWMHRVSLLFAGLYFGWASCDALLLSGVEFAHALRIIPNLLYYAAFLPFVFATAPASAAAYPVNARAD